MGTPPPPPPCTCCWRPLIVICLGVALILAANLAGNELIRRQRVYSASRSLAFIQGGWAGADGGDVDSTKAAAEGGGRVELSSRTTVQEFTAGLSEEERQGWRVTPRYTSNGFAFTRLPAALRAELLETNLASVPSEEEANAHLSGGRILLSSIAGTGLERRLAQHLGMALEAWTGQRNMDFINSYGPRTYHRGATLAAHGDRIRTHAVSAIVWVEAKNMQRPWALQFVPNDAADDERVRDVYLDEKTDVLLYESTQPHGRVDALEGDSYAALFMHWRPQGWHDLVVDLIGEEEE